MGKAGAGRALYEEMKARILDGTFAAGTALPSSRACAAERGLARSTVSVVYEQLAAEGLVVTRPGGACRVAAGASGLPAGGSRPAGSARGRPAPEDAPVRLSAYGARVSALVPRFAQRVETGLIDFLYGPLAGRDFPVLAWTKAQRKVEADRPARLAYIDPRGDPALRRALQAHLARTRGIACEPGQLLVVNGSQQALDLAARVLLDEGDTVVVENPGYRMAHHVFQSVGARLHGVDVDAQGLRTEDLQHVRKAVLACVTPTHQFPLGGFLAMGRRQALLQWAAARGAWVIEDDYDSEYRHGVRPEQALQSLDRHGRVIYVGTFSKTLSPQLRLGYMVLPHALADVFAAAKRLADRHAPAVPQRALAALLEDGSYDRHVRRMRRLQQARRVALLTALERHLGGLATVQGAATGLHCVAWLPGLPHEREAELAASVRRLGVAVYPAGHFYLPGSAAAGAARPAGLVLGYALLEADSIDAGVERLARVVRQMSAGRGAP